MSCCKPNSPPPEPLPRQSSQPKYKYSFKHQSKILVETMTTSAATNPLESIKQNSPPLLNEYALQQEYNALRASERDLDHFIVNKVKPLEDQVKFYEYQVMARRKEIEDLEQLLRAVKRMRGHAGPPSARQHARQYPPESYR